MLQITTLPRRILAHPLGRRLAVGAAGTMVVRGLGAVATVGSAALLARLLGPRDYGIYAYAVSWALLLGTIAGLGLDVLATREIAQARARGEPGTVRAFVRWSARLVALTGSVAAVLIAIVGLLVPAAWKPEAAAGLAWAAPAALAIAGLRLVQGLLQGSGRVVLSQALQPLVLPALLALLAGALHLGGGLDAHTALFAYTAAGFAALATGMPALLRALPADAAAALPRPDWRRSVRTFALLNLSALATSHLLLPIFGLTRPATEVALLDLAFRLSFLVFLPFQIINSVSSPIVIQLWTNRDVKLLQRIYNISRAISFLSGALAIVLLLLVAPALCTILELKDCALFRNVLFILCVGQLAYAACGPVAWLLYAAGHENVAIRIQLYALLFMVTLTPITTTLWGATGAAFTSTLALWAWRLSLARAARRVMCSQTDPQAR